MNNDYEISLSEMAATLAHEVRNPLALVLANINLLERDCQSPAAKRRFGQIKREIEKISGMCRDLTDLTGILREEGETELNGILYEVTAPFIAAYSEEISLEVCAEEKITVPIPPKILRIILNNIVKNAIEAIRPKKRGLISISAGKREEKAVITVQDNGIGMDNYTPERALKPGFSTKHGQGGSGIGLYAVKTLVTRYGGEVCISGKEENGCTVVLIMPMIAGECRGKARLRP